MHRRRFLGALASAPLLPLAFKVPDERIWVNHSSMPAGPGTMCAAHECVSFITMRGPIR